MTLRWYALLYALGLSLLLAVSMFQPAPGYMDAEYYFAGGLRIANGFGFTEPFIWNYLADPQALPVPSHAYWMPLASILAAAVMNLAGAADFTTARLGFILLAACVPPLTAALSYSLTSRRDLAVLAGLLAAIPGFYLPFLTVTDTFGIYMLLGASFFLGIGVLGRPVTPTRYYFLTFIVGLIAGLMHLARADGFLWLLAAFLAIYLTLPGRAPARIALPLSLCLAGYALVMAPWIARNLVVFEAPLAPGGSRSLWLLEYDELFNYPPETLTLSRWWSAGLTGIIKARLWSAGQNLQTTIAVQGAIFLLPLSLLGLWRLRRDARVAVGVFAWVLTFLAMTLLFPFSGARGGVFHSGAALQPLIWASAPLGLDMFVTWGGRRRGWQVGQARIAFGAGLVTLAVLLTALTTIPRLFDADLSSLPWGRSQEAYEALENVLGEFGASPEEPVLVNNPPGYFLASGRLALAVPNGDLAAAIAVADRYGARYMILDNNHPKGLAELYYNPGNRPGGLIYLTTYEGAHIFKVEPVP